MVEHEINQSLTISNSKGKTVYYACPKSQRKLANKTFVERIVRETAFSGGNVKSTFISLNNVMCDAYSMDLSVNLAKRESLSCSPFQMIDMLEDVTKKMR